MSFCFGRKSDRLCRTCHFSFCTICGIIISTNPPGLSKKRIRADIC
nr:MAG TPA: IBR domain, a half RING-finger domain [Caudoviricetes sp.]